jgi:endonuclease YncB( thermonuclease family)
MKYLYLFVLLLSFSGCDVDDSNHLPSGKVVAIADGDTFTLLSKENKQIKIRLYGIDTPEKKQPYGTVARQYLSELIFGQQVHYEVKDIDRYQRTIAIAFTLGKKNVNEEMLKAGYAWHYKQYDKNLEWSNLEVSARRNGLGLWADPNATPPWEWRKKSREPSVAE